MRTLRSRFVRPTAGPDNHQSEPALTIILPELGEHKSSAELSWTSRLTDFLAFAQMGLETVRILRTTFFERIDLAWQARAADMLKANGLDFSAVVAT